MSVHVYRLAVSGAIEAVYGPYSKARADWLATEIAGLGANNWTVMPLSDFREPPQPDP